MTPMLVREMKFGAANPFAFKFHCPFSRKQLLNGGCVPVAAQFT